MTSNARFDEATRSLTPRDVLGADVGTATWEIRTHAEERAGMLPFTAEFLVNDASGYHFGMSQNAGMGWNPAELLRIRCGQNHRDAGGGQEGAGEMIN